MRPTRRPAALAGHTLLLALVVTLTACSGDEPGALSTPSATPTPSATTEPAEPSEPVQPVVEPDPVPPTPDRPTWRTPTRPGEPIEVRRFDGDFLGLETRGVVRLTVGGREAWRWITPTRDDTFPFFVGDVPVSDHVVPGGGHEVSALDPATGRVVWSRPSNGSATGADGRVFAVSCSGRGEGRACVQTAYDVRDGSTLWSTPIDAETDFSKVVVGRVLSKFAQDSDPARFVVVDAVTGSLIATGLGRNSREYTGYETAYRALEPRVRDVVGIDRDPGDGCRSTVTFRDRDGADLWTSRVASAVKDGKRPRCRRLETEVVRGDVVVTGGTPGVVLLDGRTGKVRWTSDLAASTFGVGGAGVLIVRTDEPVARDGRLVGLDLRDGDELWTAVDDIDQFDYRTVGGYLVGEVYYPDNESQTVALDLRSGEVLARYRGRLEAVVRQRGSTSLLLDVGASRAYRSHYAYGKLPRTG